MMTFRRTLAFALPALVLAIQGGDGLAQCNPQVARLVGPAAPANLHPGFGAAVALSTDGTVMVVGSPYRAENTGAAYVWVRGASGWVQQAELVPTDPSTHEGRVFGAKIAVSTDGGTTAVASTGDGFTSGAVFIFVRSGGEWVQQGPKLLPTSGLGCWRFGSALKLSADGGTLAVGATDDTTHTGAAYVFTRSAGGWALEAKLTPSSPASQSFGSSVALSADGDTLLVGAPRENWDIGAAYAFTRAGAVWTQQGPPLTRTPDSGEPEESVLFGTVALSADGATAVIGASRVGGNDGAAYVFTRSNGLWNQGATLRPTRGEGRFGSPVAISPDGSVIACGAYADDMFHGAVYLFKREGGGGGGWSSPEVLHAFNRPSSAQFGAAVSMSGEGSIAVGAPGEGASHGAAYLFAIDGDAPITVVAQPASGTLHSRQNTTLSVVADSPAPVSYLWRLNGEDLPANFVGFGLFTSDPTRPTLRVSASNAAVAGAFAFDCVITNSCGFVVSAEAVIDVQPCGTADFNDDGDSGTEQDIEAFFACLAGNCCAACYPGGVDFNGDGDFGTDQDIEAFFRVLAGGAC
jgi:hypothetical protein